MSISLSTTITKSILPHDAAQTSVIKKTQEGTTDAVKVQFAEMLQGGQSASQKEVVTTDEKKFFSKLFPEAASAIQSYTGYSPAGAKKPVALGTIIDAKG
jgi:hypothetical protein